MDANFLQVATAINVFMIVLPVSLVAAEYMRSHRPSEGLLLGVLLALGILELTAIFAFSSGMSGFGYALYRAANGVLFVTALWILFAKDLKDGKRLLSWMKGNTLIFLGVLMFVWVAWRNELLSDRAFFFWQVIAASYLGYAAMRVRKTGHLFIMLLLFFWIVGHSVATGFLPFFYFTLSALLFADRLHVVLELDSLQKQLVREKETTFKLINDIGTSVRDIRTSDETLQLVLRSAIEATHAGAGAIYIYEDSPVTGKTLRARTVEGAFTPLHAGSAGSTMPGLTDADAQTVDKTLIQERELKLGEALVGYILKQNDLLLIEDAKTDDRIKRLGGSALNIRNLATVPVKIQDELLGILVCVNKRGDRAFSMDDSSVLQTLADQAALSVNNARLYSGLSEQERMQRELEIAKEIQMRLLPKRIPVVNGIHVSTIMKTAREVGGDYYDCVKLDENRMGLIIGDVAGKGVPAGMIVLIVRTVLHILVHQLDSAKQVISTLSSRVYSQMESREFMTFLYLLWDHSRRVIQYAGAGHEHILHYERATEEVHRIRSGGVAIGMHPDIDQFVEEREIAVRPGDAVLLYTDGITEAKKASGEMFGLDRLQQIMKTNAQQSPDDLKEIILREVSRFVGDAEQYDDMTLMICKFV